MHGGCAGIWPQLPLASSNTRTSFPLHCVFELVGLHVLCVHVLLCWLLKWREALTRQGNSLGAECVVGQRGMHGCRALAIKPNG